MEYENKQWRKPSILSIIRTRCLSPEMTALKTTSVFCSMRGGAPPLSGGHLSSLHLMGQVTYPFSRSGLTQHPSWLQRLHQKYLPGSRPLPSDLFKTSYLRTAPASAGLDTSGLVHSCSDQLKTYSGVLQGLCHRKKKTPPRSIFLPCT